ncbi:MAG: diguanylate cyclase [Geobacteraceae bacterium]|nr:diguanylate cyclase [Geobacteraceae bacterium]NTW79126.1 diguanylate cyclase [Geobacteraceae bacterium]
MRGLHFIFAIALLVTILVGYIDHLTGANVSMMIFYAVPILIASRFCGRIEGIVVATCAAIVWLTVNILHTIPEEIDVIFSWNAISRLGIFVLIAYSVSLQTKLRIALEREILRADTDRLTGLLNKGAFRERVEDEMNRALRYNHPLSLAFIDLDNFKQVNDSEGHARGDKLLQAVSETIVQSIRKTDIAGRIGGDEFTICFPEADEESVRTAISKLVQALDIMTSQSGWQVTASIGVVTCLEICDTYDCLLGKADKLMYVAKEKGKNAAEFMTINGIQDK